MDKKVVQKVKSNYLFVLLYLLALVLLFLLFRPYFAFLVLGGIIVIFLYPVNEWVRSKVKNRMVSSWIMVILVLLIILIPTFFLAIELGSQARAAYVDLAAKDWGVISSGISQYLGFEVDFKEFIVPFSVNIKNYFTGAIPEIIGSLTDLTIKLFLMFFLIYYAFKDGDKITKGLMSILPVTKSQKKEIEEESKRVLYGVMYGQLLVSLLQGVLGGLGFLVFGIPNPVLWGFVMFLFAFIPFLGTPMIFVPASLLQIANGYYFSGLGMLIFGLIVVMNIDNVIKPKIIGDRSGMHPLLVVMGIFGGLHFFGVIGMIIGPIVVALCALIIKFYNEDFIFNPE
ncbi:hypothetical protein COV13_04400 [Candidatus Woesearchaeota archaeon CG10_big_fil_rev_8_21_14_0_10_32_9]|nr:MAG: hypothetical protein COV13_04400 [Candidatus Woesearchaeota archaeon CG10_big_fil_rev_8_21_14_0_10_32_9]